MIKKSLRKDWLSSEEELELSRLEVPVKSKSDKSRIELMMLFVRPRLPLLKESSLEEELLFSTPQEDLTSWLLTLS